MKSKASLDSRHTTHVDNKENEVDTENVKTKTSLNTRHMADVVNQKSEVSIDSRYTHTAEIDTSSTSGIVRNKAMRAKFESLLRGTDDTPPSPGSATGSPRKTYLRRADGDTAGSGFEFGSQGPGRSQEGLVGEKLVTSASISRIEEVQSMIREGTVSRPSRQLSSGVPSSNNSPVLERRQTIDKQQLDTHQVAQLDSSDDHIRALRQFTMSEDEEMMKEGRELLRQQRGQERQEQEWVDSSDEVDGEVGQRRRGTAAQIAAHLARTE